MELLQDLNEFGGKVIVGRLSFCNIWCHKEANFLFQPLSEVAAVIVPVSIVIVLTLAVLPK